ncbi:protein mono-ADP-ribosyltransferase PARP12 isoform X2 [Narcine bancroftii]|uniref:protein mono-ADP-ribosyltransferase PARP12 isoform X2 n=1 Tax=Narcine bancroftii TaxID=1343680 RepID=UPI0038314B4A
MSLDRVRDHCLQTLCSCRGSLDYANLRRDVSAHFKVSDGQLSELLADRHLFTTDLWGPPGSQGERLIDSTLLIATTPVRLCKDFVKRNCSDAACGQLHLCKFFLLDSCKFVKGRVTCIFSHDIHSPHNAAILYANKLQHLNEMQLRQILLQNDSFLLPEICVFYNKGLGPFGSCTFKHSCTKLHICLHFVQDTCRFGAKCKRCHNFQDSSVISVLENLGAEHFKHLHHTYQNMYAIRKHGAGSGEASGNNGHSHTAAVSENRPQARLPSRSSIGDMGIEEICLYFVWKNCSFKDKCIRVHFRLPYRWQVCQASWIDLPEMEKIEKDFCDPSKTRSEKVDFKSMTSGLSQVRRLSTVSSVTKPPYYILTTEWLWYWKDEFGKWIEYGKDGELHAVASITSTELEKAFLADSKATLEFTAGKRQYKLNFEDMLQTNLRIRTRREVRRRPRFISEQDMKSQVQNQRKVGQETSGIMQGKSLPEHWDKSALSDVGYKLVSLAESSDEYKQVQTLFQRTMRKNVIQKIERIQNLTLWEVYQWQKEQMKKKNGQDVVEKQLFHGTDSSIIDAICQQNFDWRICGTHGTSYGKGPCCVGPLVVAFSTL